MMFPYFVWTTLLMVRTSLAGGLRKFPIGGGGGGPPPFNKIIEGGGGGGGGIGTLAGSFVGDVGGGGAMGGAGAGGIASVDALTFVIVTGEGFDAI